MIVQINDLDEYKKVSSEILGSRFYKSKKQLEDPNYKAGYSWIINDPELMKNEEIREIFGNNSCICDEFIKYHKKICSVCDGAYVGFLIGIEITEEDFYYVIDYDGKINHCSCVCIIELA